MFQNPYLKRGFCMRRFTRSKFSKRLAVGLFIIALLITVALAPFLAPYRSLAVMGLYDRYFEASSLPRDYGLKMQMPLRENGFFPFLINFQADAGMSAWFDQHLQNQLNTALPPLNHLPPIVRFMSRMVPYTAAISESIIYMVSARQRQKKRHV
jgi:hypothetical protein